MKKLIKMVMLILVLIIAMTGMAGCEKSEGVITTPVVRTHEKGDYTFVTVYEGAGFYIIVDEETKVMYAVSDGFYNRGTWTALLNADGTPKLYNGNLK